MTWTRIGITLTTTAALLSTLLAASTVWLLMTSPTQLAGALDQGAITPLAREVASVLATALRQLLAYL